MFKCYDCNETFSEPRNYTEKMGEYFGVPAYAEFSCCPHCGSNFDEAIQCEKCGEWFFEDELTEGYCEICVEELEEEFRYDAKKCYELTKEETEKIEINAFLVSQYSIAEIEELLLKDLIESQKQGSSVDFIDFINENGSWFIEKIKEEVQE